MIYGHRTWQTGQLSKVMWPCDHVATWSHVTNKKRYISTSPNAMTAKLGKVEISNKGPPSIKSFDALSTWSSDHVTDKERYISTSARTMAKKLDRVVGSNKKRYISTSPNAMTPKLGKVEIYNKGPPSIKSFDALSTWSSDHVTDKERYISTSARTMAKKLDRVVGSNASLLSTRSHNLLITWSHKVIKQMEKRYKFIFIWPVAIKFGRTVAYD